MKRRLVANLDDNTTISIHPMKDIHELSNQAKYLIFTVYSLIFVLFGFLMDSPKKIMRGIHKIIVEPDVLITDYIEIGGMGATFVNSGILMLLTLLILYFLKADLNGIAIGAVYLMGGFALFGKNIFNVWLIIAGVVLYAKIKKEKVQKYIYTALFGTSLAPIISEISFGMQIPIWSKIVLSILVGLSIGLLLPPLSIHLFRVHKGFNLYNVGFTAGIIGTIYVSLFRSYGFVSYSKLVWSEGNNIIFGCFLTLYFLSMMILGFLLNRNSFRRMRSVISYSGVLGTDLVELEGLGVALFNMGINGVLALLYILIIGGDLNGPTIGGILTIMSFGAYGKHFRNVLPIFLGVAIGSLTKIWHISDPHIQLAALFGTGLAPIGGHYGWVYGVIAGFINSSVVLNSGILHGGMNLYNTGFAAGIVAAVLIPVIEAFHRKIEKVPAD